MKKTIWCLFYRSIDTYGATPDFVTWWSEFPQLWHIEQATKRTTITDSERIKLLDNQYVENRYTGEWSLREIEEGVGDDS